MKATISMPTRGRPDLLLPTLRTTLANLALPDTRIVVAVDTDDKATVEALDIGPGRHPTIHDERVIYAVEPREDTLGEKWNRAVRLAPADLYIVMVDYAPHLTQGFDRMYLEAAELFPDNIGVVQNDLANNVSFSSSQAITAGLVAKMGWMYPPYFPYWFVDHWIDDIASLIGRRAYVSAKVDNARRPGTRELREPGWWASYFDLLWDARLEQARSIVDSEDFLEPEWRKEILRAHHPLIEYRSKWINENCRQMNDQMERQSGAGPGDTRYLRLKKRAMDEAAAIMARLKDKGAAA